MDLADAGSGHKIAELILKGEPDLSWPVPIEDLARQLDIVDINELETDGFEGGLIADKAKNSGFILVNKAARLGRRRFTIGHELGHFLIPRHKPRNDQFLCSRDDLRRWDRKEQDAYFKMEVEANEFAALLLMPPPLLRKYLDRFGDPDVAQIVELSRDFRVSKEAAARSYATYHDQMLAVVITKHGRIDRIYRNPRFPHMSVHPGDPVPRRSAVFAAAAGATAMLETGAEQWLESEWGQQMPGLYEQVLPQHEGYALILLWAELAADKDEEEEDRDADRTAKERYRDRMARWRG